MSNSKQAAATKEADFVLKHRITGAAVLLFFGALVLPWLLGPPSEAKKTPTALLVEDQDSELSSTEIEEELLANLSEAELIEPEQVYISKITPLDAVRVEEELRRAEQRAKEPEKETAILAVAEVAPADKSAVVKKNADDNQPAQSTEKKSAVVKKKVDSTVVSTKERTKKSDAKSSSKSAAIASEDKTGDNKSTKVTASREDQLAAALAAESGSKPASKIDVGWVVQVGVFTDKNGAEKVVKDLSSKGFTPSTSTVDTNRGKGTGTRVWLGPFAQRVDAAKTKTRLTERTGEPGFIRAYP